jgi:hypothetical protein
LASVIAFSVRENPRPLFANPKITAIILVRA